MQWKVCEVVEQITGLRSCAACVVKGRFGFMTSLMNSWGYSYSLARVSPSINRVLAPRADFDTRKHSFKHTCTSTRAQTASDRLCSNSHDLRSLGIKKTIEDLQSADYVALLECE